MSDTSEIHLKKKPTSACNQKVLGDTMSQLKEALDRWQMVQPNTSEQEGEPQSEWLAETRSLLEELNRKLDDLSQ